MVMRPAAHEWTGTSYTGGSTKADAISWVQDNALQLYCKDTQLIVLHIEKLWVVDNMLEPVDLL